jgi:non-specific serine/threonine protein kinase
VLWKVGAAVVALLAFVVVTGVGPNLPGPKLREALGLADPPPIMKPCVPRPSGVRSPRTPAPAAGRWRLLPPDPYKRDELRAAAIGDTIYLANGHGPKTESISLVETYDVRSRRYGTAPPTPVPLDHAGMVTYGGDLYLIGGYVNGKESNRLFRYSPATHRWTELRGMGVARGAFATAVIGDRLYVAGGSEEIDGTPTGVLEIYDFKSGRWTQGPDMPTPAQHNAGAAVDGKFYAVGGRRVGDLSLAVAERFDPVTGRWEELPPLPLGAGGLAAVAAGGRLLAIAGGDDHEGWVTPAVWAFDPAAGRWGRLPNLRVARHGHAATVARDRVYVFGGSPCARYGRTGAAESLRAS